MKVKELIEALQSVQRQLGNVNIVVSADPEGNSFGDLGTFKEFRIETVDKKNAILFPVETVWADQLDDLLK